MSQIDLSMLQFIGFKQICSFRTVMLLNIQYLILNIHILMQYKVFCGKGHNLFAYFSAFNCENMQKDAENLIKFGRIFG